MSAQGAGRSEALVHYGARADRVFEWVLGIHLVVCLVVGVLRDNWLVVLLVGVPAFLVPLAIARLRSGSLVSRLAIACATMIFAALLIHQTHGMIEAHFGIFVLLAFLLLYCDWRPLVAAATVIAVHHVLFAWLQDQGAGVWAYPAAVNAGIVVVHAAYVVIETFLLCVMSGMLRQRIEDGIEISGFAMAASEGRLDFAFDAGRVASRPVMRAASTMQERLRDTVGGVKSGSERLAALSARLSGSVEEIADAASVQSQSSLAMAAAVAQMSEAVRQIETHAQEAHALADHSVAAATQGGSVVRAAVSEMSSIAQVIERAAVEVQQLGEKSERAAQVVGIIKEIADQTNLLALNAAIEAARAGESGRGFAVVADEVRKLSERTTQSTNEIGTMMSAMRDAKEAVLQIIGTAVAQVQAGVAHAGAAGESIDRITEQAGHVGSVVQSISLALSEQTAAAEEIARHVEHISLKAETSASATRAIAGESLDVKAVSEDLHRAMAQFRT
ncbi:methyl-accepting chemotaxis protein [Niveibacterium sp. SC-1]|uniref:methyl-accepting chemotaxis protein n=1 Tax=Niveibacterium sp. SC-1 TaxID=3135646 RepID=UPI00311D5C9A